MGTVRGQAVLVTGAGGFIGGHLTASLVREGARVRTFVRYTSRGDPGTLGWFDPTILPDVELVLGDLRDIESVARATNGIDIVFHLGAQIAIPYSYINPRDFFETNVLGSLNVAQGALANHVRRVIHVSSSEVYGSARRVPITEEHPLEPQSPYAASKLAADKLMDSYQRSYDLPVTVLRPFNTYGPHQSGRAIVPTIIAQALASDIVRLGSLTPRRDLTYVTDTVTGLLACAAHEEAVGRTVQLGTGQDVSVGDLVETVGEILGKTIHVHHDEHRVRPPNSEVQRLISSPALAESLLDWRPAVSLRAGLANTIDWIAANPQLYPTDQYVI